MMRKKSVFTFSGMKGFVKTNKFYEYAFIIVCGSSFFLWLFLIFHGGSLSNQFHIFIQQMGDFLADFTNVVGYSGMKDPYNNEVYTGLSNKNYPPLAYLIAWCFSRLVNIQGYYDSGYFLTIRYEPLFMIMFMIMLEIVVLLEYEILTQMKEGSRGIKIGCSLVIIFSQPMIFTLERGNFLILTELAVIVYIAYHDSKVAWKRELALICLGLAFGLKLTPALLGVLLLYDKKWKESMRCAIYGILFFLLPFLFFNGGLGNVLLLFRNLHLLLDPVKGWFDLNLANSLGLFGMHLSKTAGNILIMVVSASLLIFAIFLSKWERTMVAVLVLLIFPKFSQYYCIVYILPVFILFLNEKEHKRSDVFVLVVSMLIVGCFQWRFLAPHSGLVLAELSMIVLTVLFMYRGIVAFGIWLRRLRVRETIY